MYGGGVVPDSVFGGAFVCLGGALRGFHCLWGEGVVKGDVVEAVDCYGPSCLPVAIRGVTVGTVQGVMDGCRCRVWVDGDVGVLRCGYPDGLCGPCLGLLAVLLQGCALDGGRALGGDEEMHGWW